MLHLMTWVVQPVRECRKRGQIPLQRVAEGGPAHFQEHSGISCTFWATLREIVGHFLRPLRDKHIVGRA
jgi:hypothetical protein